MASTKRVQGNYDIYADKVRINGDLVVVGNTSSTSSTNNVIINTILTLNGDEKGAGVTSLYSGLNIDRGLLPNADWLFSEVDTYWSGKINGAYINVRAAMPVDLDDVVTKRFLALSGDAIAAAGPTRAVQFKNDDGLLGGSGEFSFYGNNTVKINNVFVDSSGTISTTNGLDLTIDSAGKLYLKDVLKMQFQNSIPTNVASTIQLLANVPGAGGTGLYVVNSIRADELVSKRKATWLGLVFS